jgi:predicted transcriptional regulator YdeE
MTRQQFEVYLLGMRIEIAPTKIVGIVEIGPSSFNEVENSGAKFGDSMWQKFIPMVAGKGLSLERKMYGVSWPADDQVPPQLINYFVGFEIEDGISTENFQELPLEGGAYFEYVYKGPIQEIDNGFMEAYMNALPSSGLMSREGQHLEIYPTDYDPSASEITFQILIPVD